MPVGNKHMSESAEIWYCNVHGNGCILHDASREDIHLDNLCSMDPAVLCDWVRHAGIRPNEDTDINSYYMSIYRGDGWIIEYFLQEVYNRDGQLITEVPSYITSGLSQYL